MQHAWVTAVANDKYLTPTIVLAHTLRLFSCNPNMIAIVPDDVNIVSTETKDVLKKIGFQVVEKPMLDCLTAHGSGVSEIALYPGNCQFSALSLSVCVCVCVKGSWQSWLPSYCLLEFLLLSVCSHHDYISRAGEYMRLYGWNMTQYEKMVYLDCDVMLLDNIDDLFDYELRDNEMGAVYFEEPHIVDTGENSGLLVFKPRIQEFKDLLSEWKALFKTVGE